MRQQVLGILRPLCLRAFEGSSVAVLALVDERHTTVVVSVPVGSAEGLSCRATASFTFSQLQIETLARMGIPSTDLAAGAFRAIIQELARTAADKTAFMSSVNRRLQAAGTRGSVRDSR